jgi:transposase
MYNIDESELIKMFYVYEWFIKNTNEIFYVGKGCRNRYKVRKHNRLFNFILQNNECESRIIKEFENEKDAFEFEYIRVNELKEKGQCKANIYQGGTGGTTNWWSPEKKEMYSKKNVMKNQKQRQRMSINNPMKNKNISQKVKEQNQKKVIINNIIYDSVSKAKEKYDVSFSTIKHWCEKGINPFGEKCKYESLEQIEFKGKRYNKGGCKTVIYKDKEYESPLDIAEELNISKYIVYRWVKKGFDDNGIPCRYVEDKRELEFKKYSASEEKKKPIKVNGVLYPSKKEAEIALGIKGGGLSHYINGNRKNKKYICEYVNQQPSHKNSDKSIVEGSTTNE